MIAEFLVSLAETGRGLVAPPGREPADGCDRIERVLRDLDAAARLELAHEPPPLDLALAAWAAERLYHASRALAYREAAIEPSRPAPGRSTPPAAYSADLTLRHLPELQRLVRAADAADPLLGELAELGRAWPLSSIGMALDGPFELRGIADHPSLLQLYADRVIARRDTARLADPRVRDAVDAALGEHAVLLAPELA